MSIKDSMVVILASSLPSGLVTEACAETIVVDVRFNGWVALSGKDLTSDDEMMALLETYEKLNEECAAAVAAYRLAILDNPASTLEEHRVADSVLVRTLRSVQQSLRDLSQEGSVGDRCPTAASRRRCGGGGPLR